MDGRVSFEECQRLVEVAANIAHRHMDLLERLKDPSLPHEELLAVNAALDSSADQIRVAEREIVSLQKRMKAEGVVPLD